MRWFSILHPLSNGHFKPMELRKSPLGALFKISPAIREIKFSQASMWIYQTPSETKKKGESSLLRK